MSLDKSTFDNSWYNPGPFWKRVLWYYVSAIFFRNALLPFSSFKVFILRKFGAKIGQRCYIKPGVNIKFPWFLEVGNNAGIGEDVWIDNLTLVKLGNNVTISQGALLLTGNHDYTSRSFDLMFGEIHLEDGSWVGAKATVGPGVTLHKNAILSLGSMASKDLKENGIYVGNPAVLIKQRVFEQARAYDLV